jgi:hypothetical protein
MNSEQNKIVSTQPTGSVVSIGSKQDVELLPMSPAAAKDAVIKEVSSWGGVSVHEHRMGGVEFRLGRRELGHLHGTIADLPFLRHVRDELVAAGHARPHHVLPDSGWVTVPIRTTSEVANVIELFRRNYERAAKARQQR